MDWQPLAKELDAIASDAPDKEVPAVQFLSLQRLTAWATCWLKTSLNACASWGVAARCAADAGSAAGRPATVSITGDQCENKLSCQRQRPRVLLLLADKLPLATRAEVFYLRSKKARTARG